MENVSQENSSQQVEEAANTNVDTNQATGSNFEITPSTSRQSVETPRDLESIEGRFGWAVIDQTYHVPYIIRDVDNEHIKYVAVRIIESYLIKDYIKYMHPALFVHLSIDSLSLTKAEANIYNEINFFHCDKKFGDTEFKEKIDFIVQLKDAEEVYTFFKICFKRLTNEAFAPTQRFGFMRTEPFAILPYVNVNGIKYVPYMFFRGSIPNVNIEFSIIRNWDLKYLKFLFITLGINSRFYIDYEAFMVVDIKNIKKHLSYPIQFKDFWPKDFGERSKLTSNIAFDNNVKALWIQKPLDYTPSLDDEQNGILRVREWSPLPTLPKEFFKNDVGLYDILITHNIAPQPIQQLEGPPLETEIQTSTHTQTRAQSPTQMQVPPQSQLGSQTRIWVRPESQLGLQTRIRVRPESQLGIQTHMQNQPQSQLRSQALMQNQPQPQLESQTPVHIQPRPQLGSPTSQTQLRSQALMQNQPQPQLGSQTPVHIQPRPQLESPTSQTQLRLRTNIQIQPRSELGSQRRMRFMLQPEQGPQRRMLIQLPTDLAPPRWMRIQLHPDLGSQPRMHILRPEQGLQTQARTQTQTRINPAIPIQPKPTLGTQTQTLIQPQMLIQPQPQRGSQTQTQTQTQTRTRKETPIQPKPPLGSQTLLGPQRRLNPSHMHEKQNISGQRNNSEDLSVFQQTNPNGSQFLVIHNAPPTPIVRNVVPIRPNVISLFNPQLNTHNIMPQNLQSSNDNTQGFNYFNSRPHDFTQDEPRQNHLLHPRQIPLKQIRPRFAYYRTLPQQNHQILLQPQQPTQLLQQQRHWFLQQQQIDQPRNVTWQPLIRPNRTRTVRQQSNTPRNDSNSDSEVINLITPPSSPTI